MTNEIVTAAEALRRVGCERLNTSELDGLRVAWRVPQALEGLESRGGEGWFTTDSAAEGVVLFGWPVVEGRAEPDCLLAVVLTRDGRCRLGMRIEVRS